VTARYVSVDPSPRLRGCLSPGRRRQPGWGRPGSGAAQHARASTQAGTFLTSNRCHSRQSAISPQSFRRRPLLADCSNGVTCNFLSRPTRANVANVYVVSFGTNRSWVRIPPPRPRAAVQSACRPFRSGALVVTWSRLVTGIGPIDFGRTFLRRPRVLKDRLHRSDLPKVPGSTSLIDRGSTAPVADWGLAARRLRRCRIRGPRR